MKAYEGNGVSASKEITIGLRMGSLVTGLVEADRVEVDVEAIHVCVGADSKRK